MSDIVQEAMPRIRTWAKAKGVEDKLDKALEYCRTFSGGPESDWKSHLHADMCFDEKRPSFTCAVCRRVEPVPDARDYATREGLKHYMTIGMIWHDGDQDWSFHS